MALLLHATIRHPEVPLFPPNVRDLIPEGSTTIPPSKITTAQTAQSTKQAAPLQTHPILSPPNGHNSTSGGNSDLDPAEAQLLGEIKRTAPASPPKSHPPTHALAPTPTPITTTNPLHPDPDPAILSPPTNNAGDQLDDYDDSYDTDPPAHYPKAGNGLARTLRPDSEDLGWLVDDNFEVFSHGWKADGSAVGADGGFGGMEGVEGGKA